VIAALLVLLAGLSALVYLVLSAGQIDFLGTTRVDQLTRAQTETAAGVTLPASARDLHTHYSRFQDTIVHVRFVIDPADAEPFLRRLPVKGATISSSERPIMYSDGMPNWWRPDAATSFQAVSGPVSLPGSQIKQQQVLIDTSDPSAYIVYIVAFDT
jgi:hypothetical protein